LCILGHYFEVEDMDSSIDDIIKSGNREYEREVRNLEQLEYSGLVEGLLNFFKEIGRINRLVYKLFDTDYDLLTDYFVNRVCEKLFKQ
jgi:hypothetical protein